MSLRGHVKYAFTPNASSECACSDSSLHTAPARYSFPCPQEHLSKGDHSFSQDCTALKVFWFARSLGKTLHNLLYSPGMFCLLFTKRGSFISPEIRPQGHSLREALPNLPPSLPPLIMYLLSSSISPVVLCSVWIVSFSTC